MARAPQAVRSTSAALVALTAVVALVTLAGCTVGPSERPPVAVRGDALTSAPPETTGEGPPADPNALPAPQPARELSDLSDCTAETLATLAADGRAPRPGRALQVGCGRLTVPIDPGRPELGPTRVGLTRVTMPGAPQGRPPLLVVGDVGTDGSAQQAAALAGQVPDPVLETYQLIGMDRRGAGANLLDCSPPDARAALVDANPDRVDEAALTALLDKSRAIVQDCYLLLSGALTSYRASVTADDIETARRRLGVQRLNVVGVGDGADAVATWATAHPGSIGRVVLDGPSDPTQDDPARTEAATRAAEAAFDQFAVACRADPACPLGPDPRATVSALVDRVTARPLPTPDGDQVSAGAVLLAVRTALAEPRRWPQLTAALAAAGDGNPAGMTRLLSPEAGPQGRFDAALATRCNDSRARLTPPEAADVAARWKRAYPLFGAQAAQQLITCAPWPSPGPAPTAGPMASDAPPVLVIGTAHDPRAPLAGAQRVAEITGTGRLVRWEGTGTGAYPRTPCVTGAVDRALVSGVAPTQDVVCPP